MSYNHGELDAAVAELEARMGPGRPSRPSELVMNPNNDQASTRRRARLLAAFRALSEDAQASLLELVETVAFNGGEARYERGQARDYMHALYRIAGWEE